MNRHFIKNPNLPDFDVGSVIIGESHAEKLSAALAPHGVNVIACPENPRVDSRLASHADLSIIHLGGRRLLVSEAVCHDYFLRELHRLGAEIIISQSPAGGKYPQDCGICALILGDKLFHSLKHTDKLLLQESTQKRIHLNQGYAKCTVCPITETAAITTDHGAAKVLATSGIDVLTVTGSITLDGFEAGFFGGAAFKLSKTKLALTGTLENCPEKPNIEAFLAKHGVTPIFLTNTPAYDIGSILPLTHKP